MPDRDDLHNDAHGPRPAAPLDERARFIVIDGGNLSALQPPPIRYVTRPDGWSLFGQVIFWGVVGGLIGLCVSRIARAARDG